MIDWLTVRLPLERLSQEQSHSLRLLGDRIMRFSPATGTIEWESQAWDSIRSDSHQLSYRVTAEHLWFQGSPARCFGDKCNVFGAGASASEDVIGCVSRMIEVMSETTGVDLPKIVQLYLVSRIDVTKNLAFEDLRSVRVALRVLRDVEGGRYRVSTTAGDTVYWSHRSRIRKGKAYAKGPHILYQLRKQSYDGRTYSPSDIKYIEKLLRLELTLGAQWLREKAGCDWWELSPGRLNEEWEGYFGRMLGHAEVNEMKIEDRLKLVSPTDGQALAAFNLWCRIRAYGWEESYLKPSRSSYYRSLKLLRAAGLGDADFSSGNVVQFRRKILDAAVVNDWDQLYRMSA